jgi:cytochrome c oxidase subunit I+III
VTESSQQFSVRRWLTTTNHKDVGLLYLVTSIYFLAMAGLLALTFRVQLFSSDQGFISASSFNQAITAHGLMMILWVLSPMAFAFANYIVPIQVGAKDMAFPRLNAMSYWFYLFSGLLLVSTFFLPGGGADVGWTAYAPLNTAEYTPQPGMTVAALALLVLIASITLSTINFIVTIFRSRVQGMTWNRLPLFTWGILFTVVMMLFAFPPLAAGLLFLSSDRLLGTTFFSSIEGGDLLWENFFWFFGHPEVYVVLAPALGILFEIVPAFSRRPLYGKKFILGAFASAVFISFLVWGHHMFATTESELVKQIFSITTVSISLPFEIITIYLIGTLIRGSVRFRTPMLFALGSISMFIIGGITGVFNASIALDYQLRGSYWVVGHFHFVMAGTVIFALMAALYYWFPKMTGRMYSEKLGKLHFALSFAGFTSIYFPMLLLVDMPRRIFTYPAEAGWAALNQVATIGGFVFGVTQIFLLINIMQSLRKGSAAESNPWAGWTLEWLTPSPPPEHNFTGSPTVKGGVMTIVETKTRKGTEAKEPGTAWPLTIALGTTVAMFGAVMFLPLAIFGFAVVMLSLVGWFRDELRGKFASREEKGEWWPFEKVNHEKLGLWVFLTAELLLFGMVISGYMELRSNSAFWPSPSLVSDILAHLGGGVVTVAGAGEMVLHNIALGTVNTLILLTSSLTMVLALNSIQGGSVKGLRRGLLATLVLGCSFLVLKGIEWAELSSQGFTITSGLPAATYYVATGLHGAHVLAGLITISFLIYKASKNGYSEKSHRGVENTGLYWHMVDIVWLFLFPLFYLI